VPEDDVLSVLSAQRDEVLRLAASVPKDREEHRYADNKWTVRGIFGHIGDGERVFGYRAFCIARGDEAAFPGFDQDDYMAVEDYAAVPLAELAADFGRLRDANLSVFRRLPAERWSQVGTASNAKVTVRALAYVMAGHVRHHVGVLKTRYGVTA
jgi:DinB superfamily